MTGVTLSSSKCILVPRLAKSPSGFFLLPKENEGSGTILDPKAPLFQLKLAQVPKDHISPVLPLYSVCAV